MIIDNTKWSMNSGNEIAKGYLMIAIKLWNRNNPDKIISSETLKNILRAMAWAFDEKTTEEAYDYYINH